jgi:hypothetical protein
VAATDFVPDFSARAYSGEKVSHHLRSGSVELGMKCAAYRTQRNAVAISTVDMPDASAQRRISPAV